MTPPLPENVVADIEAAYNHADNLLHALRSALVEVEGYDPNPWWYVVTRLEDLVKWADETEDRLSVLFDEIDEGGES